MMPFVEGKAIQPYDPTNLVSEPPTSTKVDAAAQLTHRSENIMDGGVDAQTSFKGH